MGSGLIIKAGSLTLIQDLGRKGSAYYAIPCSGVMDKQAASIANTLVDNPIKAPVIECTLQGPTISFENAVSIAITGADMQWKINEERIALNIPHQLISGDILSSGYARGQLRAYIAIKGNIVSDFHFDSCASYTSAALGHNQGQPLSKGDYIRWTTPSKTIHSNPQLADLEIPQQININKGPEFHFLTKASSQALLQSEFKVGPDSNRMGARLIGKKIELSQILVDSVPVLPGFIQLPPNGQPIVVLQDGQTTGGYPRIAYLNSAELNSFNRLPIGQPFRFNLLA